MAKNESGGFDFASLKAKETTTMCLKNPNTGKDIPGVTFEVYGRDSDVFRSAKLKLDRARAKKFQGSRRFNVDPADVEQEGLHLLAACIAGWTGVVLNGEELPYSRENALKLITEVPEVYEQVDLFVGDRGNFLSS